MNPVSSPLPGLGGTALAAPAPAPEAPDEALDRPFAAVLASAQAAAGRKADGQARGARAADEAAPADEPEDGAEGGEAAAGPQVRIAVSTPPLPADVQAGTAPAPAGAVADGAGRSAAPAPAPGAGEPYRGKEMLDAEFRERFERVVARMSEEYGHRVEIVETYREQGRQEALFAQGRSRSGPVVTWTRDSNHTHGRAADVMIDGSYDNPEGYALLARVAAEEGLRTLGPRDPGHVELATGAAAAGRRGAPPLPAGGLARVAQVAEVARVAQVATVARVAQVARPGAAGRAPAAEAPPATPGAAEPIPAPPAELRIALEPRAPGTDTGGAGGRRDGASEPAALEQRSARGEGTAGDGPVAGAGEGQARQDPQAGGAGFAPRAAQAPARAEGPAALGADVAGRIARALELQDSRAGLPLSHMLLRVENPGGTEDRIRVDLRGGAVGARLDIGDVADASRLSARVEELTRALERHGLEAESVRIRATPAAENAELMRVAAALGEGDTLRVGSTRQGSEGALSRERGDASPREQRQDPRSDDSRNRSRREPKGGKGQ